MKCRGFPPFNIESNVPSHNPFLAINKITCLPIEKRAFACLASMIFVAMQGKDECRHHVLFISYPQHVELDS